MLYGFQYHDGLGMVRGYNYDTDLDVESPTIGGVVVTVRFNVQASITNPPGIMERFTEDRIIIACSWDDLLEVIRQCIKDSVEGYMTEYGYVHVELYTIQFVDTQISMTRKFVEVNGLEVVE